LPLVPNSRLTNAASLSCFFCIIIWSAPNGRAHGYRRKEKVARLEIVGEEDGSQVCDTQITVRVLDDQAPKLFQDADCVSASDGGILESAGRRSLRPKAKGSKGDPKGPSIKASKKSKKGAFKGDSIDGSTLSLFRGDVTGWVVASVNEVSTNMIYHIRADGNGDLFATETHVSDLLPEGEPKAAAGLRRQLVDRWRIPNGCGTERKSHIFSLVSLSLLSQSSSTKTD
jgi:hypothetical protein